MGSGSSKHNVIAKGYKKKDDDRTDAAKHTPTASSEEHEMIINGEQITGNNNEQIKNINPEDQGDIYKGEPAVWSIISKRQSTPEKSDETNNDRPSELTENSGTSEKTEKTVPEINDTTKENNSAQEDALNESNDKDSQNEKTEETFPEINDTICTKENNSAQENALNESSEKDSQNEKGIEANVDDSKNFDESNVRTEGNGTGSNDPLLINREDKLSSIAQRNVNANADAKAKSKERETDSGKQHDTDSGKERETNSGKERETDSGKERDTNSGKERDTNSGKERDTDSGKQQTSSGKPSTEKKHTDNGLNDNLKFYSGKINSRPFPGYKLLEMLKWKGDFAKLESNHSYIQWLFPITEGSGMNHSAQPLQEHEAEAIRNDTALRMKVLKAFKMMLDFYGMVLHNAETGKFKRSNKWKSRYAHLNKSVHNYLRITRILKSLGELGWEHLQVPWVEFLMDEAEDEQALPRLSNSNSVDYWIHAIKDEAKQSELFERYHKMRTGVTATVPSDNKMKKDGKTDKMKDDGKSDKTKDDGKPDKIKDDGKSDKIKGDGKTNKIKGDGKTDKIKGDGQNNQHHDTKSSSSQQSTESSGVHN